VFASYPGTGMYPGDLIFKCLIIRKNGSENSAIDSAIAKRFNASKK